MKFSRDRLLPQALGRPTRSPECNRLRRIAAPAPLRAQGGFSARDEAEVGVAVQPGQKSVGAGGGLRVYS
jgi:hypothetical protein